MRYVTVPYQSAIVFSDCIVFMSALPFRKPLRQLYLQAMRRVLYKRPEITPGGPAIVFAPHQDDETLACGGTILKKRRSNVRVEIVFMGDGASTNPWFSPAEMRSMRLREALAAVELLGVDKTQVRFLDFPERKVGEHELAAARAVYEILTSERPQEVFIPCSRDRNSDHVATNRIVWTALSKYGAPIVVYEYAIWFWHHWPLVDSSETRFRRRLGILREGLIQCSYLLREFNCCAFVGDVLKEKRAALAQHASQTKQLVPDPLWSTLHDVANGEWLPLLFQEYEVFRRSSAPR